MPNRIVNTSARATCYTFSADLIHHRGAKATWQAFCWLRIEERDAKKSFSLVRAVPLHKTGWEPGPAY